ncbi:50S ribosomal protein L25/general stress protein Ctc [Quadrisphaera sp. DSM 44207]|uniref:50S ribosomal protein L25/general stress protein Ctc n=1 Tax=Quadrisphaera sp. DSM 44207 TaxID=1881057 RepID=UPI00088B17F1|nr:50S ribosomal protein L25/general stress protein Ctc [Quadrisphaera sp. DSM 44207]SDQ67683.1 LSU ribosomal protein L25P [Quadrisphaera sp. DSM 44207]
MSQNTDAGTVTGTSLTAETRTQFGKGAARRIRRAHKIPAVLYGHGEAPRHISLPGHETMLAVKHANALLSLQLEGGENALAVVKDVQVEPIRREIEHLDLVLVRRGERIEVQVPVHLSGEADPGAVVAVEANTLGVTAEATHLPEVITVDVEGAQAGTQVTAGQVRLPAGVELSGDPEAIVVSVVAAPSAADVEADLAASEAELGIEHDPKDEPAAEDAATTRATDAASDAQS